MRNTVFLLFSAIICLCVACGETYMYKKDVVIDASTWTYPDTLSFSFHIPDYTTNNTYSLYLHLEHSPEYAYRNMYMMVHTILPSGKKQSNQVSINLMGNEGLWYGKCRGNNCKVRVVLLENHTFEESGNYAMVLEQYMRVDSLAGIHKLGLAVTELESEQ